ncbi:MAG: YbaB/EbfC family nucleoid-associated protein [Clostridiales bacterium]|nr:YbaB/EbfC family nucleoid-associated protein [Clostridiales bacterium]
MAKGFNQRGMRSGNGGLNMNMIRQAQKLSESMQKSTAELEAKEYSAQSGGGAVSVTITGKRQVKRLTIAPEAIRPEDAELLQDMLLVALNEANRLADEDKEQTMGKLTGGLSL